MRMSNCAGHVLATLLFLMMSLSSQAGDNVLSSEGGVLDGEEVILAIDLTNVDTVIGVQFDLMLPDGLYIQTGEKGGCVCKATARLKEMSVISRRLESGRYRFLAFSMQCKPVQGPEGAIIEIPLKKEASLPSGEYEVKAVGVSLSLLNTGNNMNYNHEDFTIPVVVK